VVDQQIGVGDGSTKSSSSTAPTRAALVSRNRKITRPVEGSVTAYVNVRDHPAAIDYDDRPPDLRVAPALAAVITADFEHDVPVRFADDELEVVGPHRRAGPAGLDHVLEIRE
jgi:uncharacterized protein (TIGR02217 family)